MKTNIVCAVICAVFWLAAAILGIIFPDRDWRISYVIASFTLCVIMGIYAGSNLRKLRDKE